MIDYINVRYSLTVEEHQQLKRIQEHYEKKLHVSKLSQADVLRHMMRDVEALIESTQTMHELAR
jgi:hypothetical protein